MNKYFPTDDMELTHILVISNLEISKSFYKDILGAETISEYGGISSVHKFQGNWLPMVTDGKPTKDKPDVTFAPPGDPKTVSHSFAIREKDCNKSYELLKTRGAEYLTPPVYWVQEIR